VQFVCIYLVFASAIVPALAGRLAAAYAVGLAGYILGLVLWLLPDLPAGAPIVCAVAISGADVFSISHV
jgi:zinc/manganese transport system permease protein